MSAPSIAIRLPRTSRVELRLRRTFILAGPLLVGIIVALPPFLVLSNSFNVAAPGRDAVYGLENWVRAFSNPATVTSLWNAWARCASKLE